MGGTLILFFKTVFQNILSKKYTKNIFSGASRAILSNSSVKRAARILFRALRAKSLWVHPPKSSSPLQLREDGKYRISPSEFWAKTKRKAKFIFTSGERPLARPRLEQRRAHLCTGSTGDCLFYRPLARSRSKP